MLGCYCLDFGNEYIVNHKAVSKVSDALVSTNVKISSSFNPLM